MAFTLAHMAAALPFYGARRRLCFDALLIGTMMPDLPYYVGSSNLVADHAHQWGGIITYNLPVGLLVFAAWYWGVKPALVALIAPFLKTVAIYPPPDGYKKVDTPNPLSVLVLSVIFGLIVGAVTHIIWDGITHTDGFIAQQVGWLQMPIYIYPFKGTSMARVLQYVSSIVGLLVLLGFGGLMIKRWYDAHRYTSLRYTEAGQTRVEQASQPFFTTPQSIAIISVMIALSLLWWGRALSKAYWILSISPYTFAAQVLVDTLQGVATLIAGFTVIYHLITRIQKHSG